nr:uncharacterized protein I203_04779 [Kwoniella mangroviensis CBS 8507]OCF66446.1 hypothetical protein I203_04779 [Kwoniella mangroviensis CBS 8507]
MSSGSEYPAVYPSSVMTGPTAIEYQGRRHACSSCNQLKRKCQVDPGSYIADSCLTCDARDPRLPCTFRNSRTKRADRRAQHGWLNREPTTLDDYGLRAYIDAPDGVQTLNAIFQEKLGLEYTVSTSQSQNLAPIHHDSGFVWELDNVDDPQHELGAAELVREGAMQGLDFSFGATPSINVSHWPSSDATYDSNE